MKLKNPNLVFHIIMGTFVLLFASMIYYDYNQYIGSGESENAYLSWKRDN